MLRLVAWLLLVSATVGAAPERLSGMIVPERYDITFAPDLAKGEFAGSETIEVEVTEPAREVALHAVDLTIGRAEIGGKRAKVKVDAANEMIRLSPDRPLAKGRTTIVLEWRAKMADKLRGLYAVESEGRKFAFSQFEAADARRAFPCFDEPAWKARFRVTAVIDPAHAAVSNGEIVDEKVERGRKRVRFAETPRMSTYLVALGVGPLAATAPSTGKTPIRVVCAAGKERLGAAARDTAVELVARLERYFGMPFPYRKLDLVAVPDFAYGGMENAGAIFFRETEVLIDPKTTSADQRRRAEVVLAHEIAHQWFGDLVTMAWWDDLWLNEAFATWMESRIIDEWRPQQGVWVDFEEWRDDAMQQDELDSTHAVRSPVANAAEADENFDSVTYAKGATVLRMLETYVGEEAFRRGVSRYLQDHAEGNATAGDLWRALGEASGQPVAEVAQSWIDQPGHPALTVGQSCQGGRTVVTVEQHRFFANRDAATDQKWAIPVCARNGAGVRCELLREVRGRIELDGCGGFVLVNARHGGFYRVSYDAAARRALIASRGRLEATERIALLDDAWALARQGAAPLDAWLELAEGMRGDRSRGVEDAIVSGFDYLGDRLVTDEERGRFARRVERQFRPLADALGWGARAGEEEGAQQLRRTVLVALGELADAADVAAESAKRLESYFRDPASLDAEVAGVVVAVGARRGDAALQDAYVRRMKGDASPQERQRLMQGLAGFGDPALARRTLERTLTPEVRAQDVGSLIGDMLGDRRTRALTWAFVQEHWGELAKKAPGPQLEIVVASVSSFCDEKAGMEAALFFGAHDDPSTRRVAKQAVQSIGLCAAMKKREAGRIAVWLEACRSVHCDTQEEQQRGSLRAPLNGPGGAN